MKLYSTGEVASLLGIHRDKVQSELKIGAPGASMKIGNRKGFTRLDVVAFFKWCLTRGIAVTEPIFENADTAYVSSST